jgi:hypothetical protein
MFSDEGLTPGIPENCPPVLEQLMNMCWKRDPNERPVSFVHTNQTKQTFTQLMKFCDFLLFVCVEEL